MELHTRNGVRARVQTDTAGAFDIDMPGAGDYRLSAARAGFLSILSDPVRVSSLDSVDVLFHMTTDEVTLDPVKVTASRRVTSPLIAAFYERASAHRNGGRFLTRQQIADMNTARTSDVLRRVAGLSVGSTRRGKMALRGRGGCEPLVFIDGMEASLFGGAFSVDEMVNIEDLEGIEVYSAASTPIQYVRDGPRGTNCGAVLFWTKQRV